MAIEFSTVLIKNSTVLIQNSTVLIQNTTTSDPLRETPEGFSEYCHTDIMPNTRFYKKCVG